MFIGTITYKEYKKIQKLEVKSENISKLLEIISNCDDLDIVEIHIVREVI